MVEFAVMKEISTVGIGLLGAGTVGSEVFNQLSKEESTSSTKEDHFKIHRVLVRDPAKPRGVHIPHDVLTTELDAVIDDPKVEIVISLLGDKFSEHDAIRRALKAGKKVITANKEVIANSGQELLGIAKDMGSALYFEAAVAGGIRIVDNLVNSYAFDRFNSLSGILNGTTNYILSKMADEGVDFETALVEAQHLGYAEPDPTNDIEGRDAAYKISILASLAFREGWVNPERVFSKGINTLEVSDFKYASYMGYVIKLVANAQKTDAGLDIWVSPTLVPREHRDYANHPLGEVNGVLNSLLMSSEPTNVTEIRGLGAGPKPTSASILSDLNRLIRNGQSLVVNLDQANIVEASNSVGQNYIRLTVSDEPGVLGKLGNVFGDHKINIAEVNQRDEAVGEGLADFVITTAPARQGQLNYALDEVSKLSLCKRVSTVMRVLH